MSAIVTVLAFAGGVLAGDWCRVSNSFTAFCLSEYIDWVKRQVARFRGPR